MRKNRSVALACLLTVTAAVAAGCTTQQPGSTGRSTLSPPPPTHVRHFDLVAQERGERGGGWADGAHAAALARAVPLAGYRVGDDGDLADLARTWPALYGVGVFGACLVRPDGHVAWRTRQPPGADAQRVVGDVLDQVLSRT